MHIAVLWKAVEFEFWNHLDLLWKSMGKVKWNLKLFLSWNKLKKWNLHSIVWLTSATILHVMMFICPICTLLFFCSFTGEFAVAAVITFPHHQVSQREISKNIFFRNEKSINSDLWILMRNFFWDTLYILKLAGKDQSMCIFTVITYFL